MKNKSGETIYHVSRLQLFKSAQTEQRESALKTLVGRDVTYERIETAIVGVLGDLLNREAQEVLSLEIEEGTITIFRANTRRDAAGTAIGCNKTEELATINLLAI